MGDVLAAARQLYPYKVRLSSLKLVPIKKLQNAHSLHFVISLKMILKISSNLNYRKHNLQLQSILSCLQRKTIRLPMVLPTMMKHLYLFHSSYHTYITTQQEKKNQWSLTLKAYCTREGPGKIPLHRGGTYWHAHGRFFNLVFQSSFWQLT